MSVPYSRPLWFARKGDVQIKDIPLQSLVKYENKLYSKETNNVITFNTTIEDSISLGALSLITTEAKCNPTYLSVKDFGAKGDGNTDDTASIINCIEEARKRGGAVVFFSSGWYKISEALNTTGSGIRFIGESRTSTMIRQHNMQVPIFKITQNDCAVERV